MDYETQYTNASSSIQMNKNKNSKVYPSAALVASYQKDKQSCPTPRYIIARERHNARLLAIKMRELHDKRMAHVESFKESFESLVTARNDKASLQPFNDIFEMSEALCEDVCNPCPSKVESFETMYNFVYGIAQKFRDGTVSVAEFVT